MDADWKVKVELKAPDFGKVYDSVKRLATFHKVEQADCEGMALVAVVEHPGRVQTAICQARRALNSERRQRLPGRSIDDRMDGIEDSGEVDRRTLPKDLKPSLLDDDGEWVENEIMEEDQARDLDTQTEDYDLPKVSPGNLIQTIIFLADHGFDVNDIADKTGVTRHRIRQIFRDREALRKEVERASAEPGLPGFGECEPGDIRAPRPPIRHKERTVRAVVEGEDHQGLSLFEMEEEELV